MLAPTVAGGQPRTFQHRGLDLCSGPAAPTLPQVTGAWLLAHQGGWDEIAFVILPILLFAGLLVVANKRAGQAQDDQERDAGNEPR